jgi:hypothetical protein
VFVRNPIDISTIRVKLDGTMPVDSRIARILLNGPALPRYTHYGEFIGDLRRVFANALKYNRAHMNSDSTGISLLVVQAAERLGAKLESLAGEFSIALCDRILRVKMVVQEEQQLVQQMRDKALEEEQQARDFERRALEVSKIQ